MQIPRFRCKMTLYLIPEPEEKASELLRDLIANDMSVGQSYKDFYVVGG